MVLALADLPAGAKVAKQGYYKDPDFAASSSYKRTFSSVKLGKARLIELESNAEVGRNAGDAALFVSVVRKLLSTKSGRAFYLKEVGRGIASGTRFKPTFVRFVRTRGLGVGETSEEVVLAIGTPLGTIQAGFAVFQIDRILASLLYVTGPGAGVSSGNVVSLAQKVSAHIQAALVSPPVNTAPPMITGTAQDGQTLTATDGTWTGSPTFASQWLRCDTAGANCVPIPGATSSTYVVTTADVGSTLVVSVTATNAAGSATAQSLPTAVVATAAPPPPPTTTSG